MHKNILRKNTNFKKVPTILKIKKCKKVKTVSSKKHQKCIQYFKNAKKEI